MGSRAMSRPSLFRSLAAILPALLLSIGTEARATILCVGADGHFEIEQADAACCHRDEHTARTPAALTTEPDGCADDCTDTLLSAATAFAASERTSLKTPLRALPALPLPLTAACTGLLPAAARPGQVAAAPPRALRTTVILC